MLQPSNWSTGRSLLPLSMAWKHTPCLLPVIAAYVALHREDEKHGPRDSVVEKYVDKFCTEHYDKMYAHAKTAHIAFAKGGEL